MEPFHRRLTFFGGKGGVGKTTSSLAIGYHLGKENKTIVVSTDPAHSLSDCLGKRVGNNITNIVNNLYSLEVDAKAEFSNFLNDHEDEIKEIFSTSTNLDDEDIRGIFSLPIPGIEEIMGLKTIIDLYNKNEFDNYIIDTAPSGHALRLLELPDLIDDWVKVIAKLRWKYRYMVESFAGHIHYDKGDDFVLTLKKIIKGIRKILNDETQCEFVPVTIPTYMSIAETENFISIIDDYQIHLESCIINNVEMLGSCSYCREIRNHEQTKIEYFKNRFPDKKIFIIPRFSEEVIGINGLKKVEEWLWKRKEN